MTKILVNKKKLMIKKITWIGQVVRILDIMHKISD
jgi:hypothetical protein